MLWRFFTIFVAMVSAFFGCLFIYLSLHWFVKGVKAVHGKVMQKIKGVNPNNQYIKEHEKHLSQNKTYKNYLDWCAKKGQIPMDQKWFNEDLKEKEKQIESLFYD